METKLNKTTYTLTLLCVTFVSVPYWAVSKRFQRVSVSSFSSLYIFLKVGNSSGEAQRIDWRKTAVNSLQKLRSPQDSIWSTSDSCSQWVKGSCSLRWVLSLPRTISPHPPDVQVIWTKSFKRSVHGTYGQRIIRRVSIGNTCEICELKLPFGGRFPPMNGSNG